MRDVRTYVVVCTCLLLVAGCGGGSKSEACAPLPGAGKAARIGPPTAVDTTFLTAVRLQSGRCADRVSFDFRADKGRPGFRADYLDPARGVVEDGSGRRLRVDGSAFLALRFFPAATAYSSGEKLVFTYAGPRRLRPDGSRYVREVVKTGDFEAVVTWVIGLSERRPFRIVTSTSPPRLVVELD